MSNMLPLMLMLAALPQPEAKLDVEYARVDEVPLQMDIYSPPGQSATPLPAVVVIHGGAWMAGTRKDMTEMAKGLADNGLVAATVSYRLAPKYKWPAMLDDVQAAVRYLRANATKYNIDPKRIGAAGASAGGHLALMLGTRDTRQTDTKVFPKVSSRVAAVFDMFGPVDLGSPDFPANLDMAFALVLGKPRQQAKNEVRDASPIHFVDSKSAPVFIYQGLADPLVPANQSKMLEKKYKDLKLVVEARYLPGIGHEFKPDDEGSTKAMLDGLAFLKRILTSPARR